MKDRYFILCVVSIMLLIIGSGIFGISKYTDGRYEPLREELDNLCNERSSYWRMDKSILSSDIKGYCIGNDEVTSFKWNDGRWRELK